MIASHSCALVDRPVRFDDCQDVLGVLSRVTAGWSWTRVSDACEPLVDLRRTPRGIEISEPGRDLIIEETAVSAACSLVAILLNRMVEPDPSMLCLHASAVTIAGRRFAFPSTHRAGKSTLTAALAFRGSAVVADDILPVDCRAEIEAIMASGVSPRLRVPLPKSLGRRFTFDAWRNRGPDDGYYRYLQLPPARIVRFGERHALDAFVFLERAEGAAAELSAVASDDAMQILLVQNFGTAAPPDIVLQRIDKMAARCPAFLLRYDTIADACALLEDLAQADLVARAASLTLSRPSLKSAPKVAAAANIAVNALVIQADGIVLRETHAGAFLADRNGGGIFALDAIGAAIWEALSEPTRIRDLADMLAETFPQIDRCRIERDVTDLISRLMEKGLARRV